MRQQSAVTAHLRRMGQLMGSREPSCHSAAISERVLVFVVLSGEPEVPSVASFPVIAGRRVPSATIVDGVESLNGCAGLVVVGKFFAEASPEVMPESGGRKTRSAAMGS